MPLIEPAGPGGPSTAEFLGPAAALAAIHNSRLSERPPDGRTVAGAEIDAPDEEWVVERDKLAERLSLVLAAMAVLRFGRYMGWLAALWLITYCSGVAVQAVLRRRRRALYLRLRPFTAAAFRAAGLGLGCATLLKQYMLEDGLQAHALPPSGHDGGTLVSVLRIVFTSGAATMTLFAFGWQTCLSLSLAAQLVLAGTAAIYTPRLCRALVVAHPSTQRELHWMHQLLSGVSLLVPLPVAPLRPPLPPESVPVAECEAVVSYLQLCSCLLPLACQTFREARQFVRQQQRRQEAGLPPEDGALAAFRHWLWRASGKGSGARLALACFVLLAVTWNCVLLFER